MTSGQNLRPCSRTKSLPIRPSQHPQTAKRSSTRLLSSRFRITGTTTNRELPSYSPVHVHTHTHTPNVLTSDNPPSASNPSSTESAPSSTTSDGSPSSSKSLPTSRSPTRFPCSPPYRTRMPTSTASRPASSTTKALSQLPTSFPTPVFLRTSLPPTLAAMKNLVWPRTSALSGLADSARMAIRIPRQTAASSSSLSRLGSQGWSR